MSSTKDKKNTSPWLYAFNSKVLEVGATVGLLTIFIVLVAVFGGIWLDNLLGTKPVITISLVLASAPLSLVLTFWVAMRAVNDVTTMSAGQVKGKPPIEEGDDEE